MRPTHADLTRFVNDNRSAASKIGFSVLALKEIWAMASGVRFNCSKDDNCRLGNSYFYEFHSVGNYTPKSKRWFQERVVVQSVFVKGLDKLDSFDLDRAGLVSGGRWGVSAKRKKSGRVLTVSCRGGFAVISSESVLFKNSLRGDLQETGSSVEFRSFMSDLFRSCGTGTTTRVSLVSSIPVRRSGPGSIFVLTTCSLFLLMSRSVVPGASTNSVVVTCLNAMR